MKKFLFSVISSLSARRQNRRRSGSALLIVLGFLSFMVVSAVAFAVYMRNERLPSSSFRRSVALRHLLKAGLVRAIDEIDYAVDDNPFPGLPGGQDAWMGRVFAGAGLTNNAVSFDETVSVLTLEGLAYIPAILVNDVRVFGRQTSTAKWNVLDYDAGRYAYVAVNLSDFLNVNNTKADALRSSSPTGRVVSSYLFENSQHNAFDPANGPTTFDSFVTSQAATAPFVSVADYNLAFYAFDNNGSQTGMISPFGDLASGTSSDANPFSPDTPDILAQLRKQIFVTDSLMASTNDTSAVNLVDGGDSQPFKKFDSSKPPYWINGLTSRSVAGEDCMNELVKKFCAADVASLYDYLDPDDIPISLTLPCTERVPLIAAIDTFNIGSRFSLKIDSTPITDSSGSEKGNSYTVSLPNRMAITGLGMFPFKRGAAINSGKNFSVQALVKIFFAPADCGCRMSNASPLRPTEAEWSQENGATVDANAITLVSPKSRVTIPSVASENDAMIQFDMIQFPAAPSTSTFPLLTVENNAVTGVNLAHKRGEGTGISGPSELMDPTSVAQVVPMVAVWMRIVDGDGNTVDLSPACTEDDSMLNGASQSGRLQNIEQMTSGPGYPVLLLKGTATQLDLTAEGLKNKFTSPTAISFDSSAFITCDPRYNFAPEDFYASPTQIDKTQYMNSIKSVLGQEGRDPDIFMFVSNQGYLQSLGEIGFLPRIQDFAGYGFSGAFFTAGRYDGSDFAARTAPATLANYERMWRTYRLYKQGSSNPDGLYDFNIEAKDPDGLAVSVNPYSDVTNILMAAFANTPYDYNVASESNNTVRSGAISERMKYCFNEFSGNTEATFKYSDLLSIAGKFSDKLRSSTPAGCDDWKSTYDNLDWYGDGDPGQILGVTIDSGSMDIDNVDKKTLFSFWRDSFSNRQQLFLIFVRVEPMILGGSGSGQTPSQLGARAVALVWRSPLRVAGKPHRTRLLFYHQLD